MFRSLVISSFLFCICSTDSFGQSLNYYFGNLHAHSGYSDGNKDSVSTGVSKPSGDYAFAKASLHFDFLGISEHNHFSATHNPGMKLANYAPGLAQAAAANQPGTFLALYGMEYGVITNGGHVIIYGFNQLIGWEAGNYDIFNSQYDYVSLFSKVKNNPNAFCYLAHPGNSDFGNLANIAYDAAADSAIVGVPFRSGVAFSTFTDYSDYPTGNYFSYYKKMLALGYHLGMGYDHDNHYLTFGRNNAGRLVILAPALTIPDLYYAMQHMHFYGSDDWNAKIDLKIGNSIMGDSLSGTTAPVINVVHNDDDAELADSIMLWSGNPGSNINPVIITKTKGLNTLSYTDNVISNSETRYYFAEIVQADGQRIITSPIWYTKRPPIGIKEEKNSFSFVMFPNPGKHNINISTGLQADYKVEIFDVSGKKVYSGKFSNPNISVSVKDLEKGYYSIKVSTDTFSKTRSLVIE